MFIGHSASISQVQFTPSSGHVISCGDAVFIWEFLGLLHPLHPFHPSTPPPRHRITSLRSASPRKRPPAPVNYEPLKMQSFTPLAQHTLKTKSHGESSVYNYVRESVLLHDVIPFTFFAVIDGGFLASCFVLSKFTIIYSHYISHK